MTALPQLQQRLLINRFLYHQLGIEEPQELMEQLTRVREGYTVEGPSYFCQSLKTLASLNNGLHVKLDEYDRRIKGYVEQLSHRRPPVQLRYFQFLAALFTELYLDRLFSDREQLLSDINAYAEMLNRELPPKAFPYPAFTGGDLNKLAFWMATGSGKTLILHINYWQYLYYSQANKPNNVLLITPYESLSAQHAAELHASGIPHRRYDEPVSLLWSEQDKDAVQLLEITKLTVKKRGGGSRIETAELGENNLLFVDEGHRGASGDVWRQLRAEVAQDGFTFEYSATFGQIVNGASTGKRPSLLEEYSKAILFDYSYPHFHGDGYGKDYWIINLKTETGEFNEWVMLSNLLSFYEQIAAFHDHTAAFRPYNLEAPLWVFVGNTVTGGKSKQNQDTLTDVQEVVGFYADFLSRHQQWIERIERILTGQTPLKQGGSDLFADMFSYIKRRGTAAADLYDDIVRRIFNGTPGETLRVVEMKEIEKEIGLRVGDDNPYFGVIRIGDVRELVKLFEASRLPIVQDNLADSLFDSINDHDSPINVLIGSRMFMEGWDCYRVSSMGLINIGRGEGSQVIQLFGRGVRLRGKNRTLKRSEALEPDTRPAYIELLETLKIFGIRADYMAQFRDLLRQEGVETEYEEVLVPIHINDTFLANDLRVPRLPEGEQFHDKRAVILGVDKSITVKLDLLPKVESAAAGAETAVKVQGGNQIHRLRDLLHTLNWQAIYVDLLAFRQAKGYTNLVFTARTLQAIMEQASVELLCLDDHLQLQRLNGANSVRDITLAILQKYTAAYYDRRRRAWEQERIELFTLERTDANLNWESYKVRMAPGLAHIAQELVTKANELQKLDEEKYPHIHFDRHLYQPLLVQESGDERIKAMQPPGLNEGEASLVRHLRDYLRDGQHKAQWENRQFFLLRNLSRQGVSFFDESEGTAFYPDFILWILEGSTQRIAFIDPHGIRNERWGSPKLALFELLQNDWQPRLNAQTDKWDVRLTSFIISPEPHDGEKLRGSWVRDHSEEAFAGRHVFFQDGRGNYISAIIGRILAL